MIFSLCLAEIFLAAFYTPIAGPLILTLPFLAVYPRKSKIFLKSFKEYEDMRER